MVHDRIAVVDFGGQYAHLIATKIRRLKVRAEILQPEDSITTFEGFKGIILSGSPALSSFDEDAAYNKGIFDLPIPILGLCFGHQEIAKHYGGQVQHTKREYGPARLKLHGKSPVFTGLGERETVWMSHGDSVTALPAGFEEIASSGGEDGGAVNHNAAIADETRKRYGFQFHPEVDDTVHGDEMLSNFAIGICGCRSDWTTDNFIEERSALLREEVGNRDVFLLVSGGVDSTVCAVLLGRALGPERVHLLHIDNGLMRKNESATVLEEFGKRGFGDNLHFVDASERFLSNLAGVTAPEEKRRIIGDTFLDVYADEVAGLSLDGCVLAQGTIYPDTIETGGTKRADVIKTHHNRVPAVQKMIAEGLVVEPLSELYKVEVREVGEKLGLPDELVWRHPFPGPGLGIRLLCSDGRAPSLPEGAESKLMAFTDGSGMEGAFLPIRSVGVKGDLRSYEYPVMVWGEVKHGSLEEFASRLYSEVPGVNRCVLDLQGKGFKDAKPVAAGVTRERLDLLREADYAVMDILRRRGLYSKVWQCPTVFLPLEIDGRKGEFCIIRPVLSERAMTARPALPARDVLEELRDAAISIGGINGIALDLTTKPPGTIEWE